MTSSNYNWDDVRIINGSIKYGWQRVMRQSDIDRVRDGNLSEVNFYGLDEWGFDFPRKVSDLVYGQSDQLYKKRLPGGNIDNMNPIDKIMASTAINKAIKNTTAAILYTTGILNICDRVINDLDCRKSKAHRSIHYAEILSDMLARHNMLELRRALSALVKTKLALRKREANYEDADIGYFVYIYSDKVFNDYRAQIEMYLEGLNVNLREEDLPECKNIGSNINSSYFPQSFTKRLGLESHVEGEKYMDKENIEIAQEGIMDDLGDFLENAMDNPLSAIALAYGAAVIPLIILSPFLAALEYDEDAFNTRNYKEDLRGLRTIFKGYIGSGISYDWYNVDKKIAKAIKKFRDNKSPIYMNELMWDKVKAFHDKHEATFNEIKYLIAEYKEKIGPKSKAKFEFVKNDDNFEAANEWLEKYVSIVDDMNEMIRHVMKDVNGTRMTPVTKVMSGPDAGQMYYVPEDTKTGRRISPDIKLAETEFFDICNEDLCANFKKTTKIKKVLGKIKNRKGPANKSMRENFEGAIRDLCNAYTHYVCYIYIMCSEAYHRKEK